jgi:hypothetical protein
VLTPAPPWNPSTRFRDQPGRIGAALDPHASTGCSADGPRHGATFDTLGSRHDQLRSTTFYEPPHDITHRHADPWRVVLMLAAVPLRPDQLQPAVLLALAPDDLGVDTSAGILVIQGKGFGFLLLDLLGNGRHCLVHSPFAPAGCLFQSAAARSMYRCFLPALRLPRRFPVW